MYILLFVWFLWWVYVLITQKWWKTGQKTTCLCPAFSIVDRRSDPLLALTLSKCCSSQVKSFICCNLKTSQEVCDQHLYQYFVNQVTKAKMTVHFLYKKFYSCKTFLGACLCTWEILNIEEQTCTLLIITW